ncbi:MAG: NAD(P)-dependent oxidoreductase [Deltaproteobacteria bacterium]|nr:NAD(P)-dependent oxidoreductase [Deltaproteobacteria bacterium]
MSSQLHKIAVLGASGRLGRAVVPALGGARVLGVGRRGADTWVRAWYFVDRRDRDGLRIVLDQADAIVDLCGFGRDDAQVLLDVCPRPIPLVFASSLAERDPAHWSRPLADLGPEPADGYGQTKRHASDLLLAHWPGPLLVALLPQLLSLDDRGERALEYLRQAEATGAVRLPGTGEQRPAVLEVASVAAVFALWLAHPQGRTRVQFGHPQPQPLRALVAALLQGAEVQAELRHGAQRGPHSAGDEHLDIGALRLLVPEFAPRSLDDAFAELGRRYRRDEFADPPPQAWRPDRTAAPHLG